MVALCDYRSPGIPVGMAIAGGPPGWKGGPGRRLRDGENGGPHSLDQAPGPADAGDHKRGLCAVVILGTFW